MLAPAAGVRISKDWRAGWAGVLIDGFGGALNEIGNDDGGTG